MTATPSRRAVLAGATAAAAGAALGPRIAAAARDAYALRPVEVASGLWMIEGRREHFSRANGGDIVNLAFARTDAGAVVFDTGSTRRHGEALRAAVAETVPLGVAAVYVTHHHPDHFFGNQAFADRPIRALPAARAGMVAHGEAYSDNLYRMLGDWMRGTEPVPAAEAAAPGPFEIGGRRFEAFALAGHTEADLAILDVETGTLIAGDLAFLDRAPTTPHADLGLWGRSLDALDALGAGATIPGHGPFDRTGEALRQTRAYLDWLDGALTDAAESGLGMAETLSAPIPPRFAALGAQPEEFQRSVAHLFPDYELRALPPVE
ncbi:MAG: quinoprotein relay system zinc metallohydrolase 1 [Rubrimonas sp.]